jgi:hypothetical protein
VIGPEVDMNRWIAVLLLLLPFSAACAEQGNVPPAEAPEAEPEAAPAPRRPIEKPSEAYLLKDGTFVKGTPVKVKAGELLVIETADGRRHTIPWHALIAPPTTEK